MAVLCTAALCSGEALLPTGGVQVLSLFSEPCGPTWPCDINLVRAEDEVLLWGLQSPMGTSDAQVEGGR